MFINIFPITPLVYNVLENSNMCFYYDKSECLLWKKHSQLGFLLGTIVFFPSGSGWFLIVFGVDFLLLVLMFESGNFCLMVHVFRFLIYFNVWLYLFCPNTSLKNLNMFNRNVTVQLVYCRSQRNVGYRHWQLFVYRDVHYSFAD